jgi:hypothetical protein
MNKMVEESNETVLFTSEDNTPEMSTVSIPTILKERLDKLKIIPREPYYEVIDRLVSAQKNKLSTKKK